MKILVIGSGGREHALCWKIAQSPLVEELVCTPGNAGIAHIAKLETVKANDIDGLVALAKAGRFDLVVIGPEDPLAGGLSPIRLRPKRFWTPLSPPTCSRPMVWRLARAW